MIKTYKPNDTARIEAILFDDSTALEDAKRWAEGNLTWFGDECLCPWKVHTLEGWVDMPYGSYLIRGTTGEFYPCDPDIFEKRWVEVADVTGAAI